MQLDVEPPFVLTKPVGGEQEFYELLDEDSPWELLDGTLVMSPASYRHEALFMSLATLLAVDGGYAELWREREKAARWRMAAPD